MTATRLRRDSRTTAAREPARRRRDGRTMAGAAATGQRRDSGRAAAARQPRDARATPEPRPRPVPADAGHACRAEAPGMCPARSEPRVFYRGSGFGAFRGRGKSCTAISFAATIDGMREYPWTWTRAPISMSVRPILPPLAP